MTTTVAVSGFGVAGSYGSAHLVREAKSDAITIAAPTGETPVTSPLTARGTYQAVDPSLTVQLLGGQRRLSAGRMRPRPPATTGPPNDWAPTLSLHDNLAHGLGVGLPPSASLTAGSARPPLQAVTIG